MFVRSRRGWELPERLAAPEEVYWSRRRLLRTAGAAPLFFFDSWLRGTEDVGGGSPSGPTPVAADLYPAPRNPRYTLDRPLTDERWATTYNNFYEFGAHKRIWKDAQALPLKPWRVRVDGLVERPREWEVEDLIRRLPLEERLYRHRCVEAWAIAVPWTGFPFRAFLDLVQPLAAARYVRMESFLLPEVAAGQRQSWYPWPYVEALTLEEAAHELAFLATGLYGKPLPPQNGAPLRLVVPWKYGFKSVKSIVRFTFTAERPKTFWSTVAGHEYGFWANVNPEVPHPRWSQRFERMLGGDDRVPTQLFNGYAASVAELYRGLEDEPLFM